MNTCLGKVFFVGAGPGDPGLLTLRGAECLRSADVVLYDYLVSQQLLKHARPDAEQICLGRHGQGRLMSQSEIEVSMIEQTRRGRYVVRLKGGDPAIFGRLSEELASLQAAGIPYEIVPGITAAQAASSYATIPLTQRDEASCVAFVTGHESAGKEPDLDYAALARFPGTLVFYMGVTTAFRWSTALIESGKPADTPVAIVRRCSLPDQQTIFTTLGSLGDELAQRKLRPPAVIIVGDVAQPRGMPNWFTDRPLFGRTILVTRPAARSDALVTQLQSLGANVLCHPAIVIREPDDWSPVDAIIRRLDKFDWLVFSSANGVHYFLRHLFALGHDLRWLGICRLAAIGPATAEALSQYHLRADIQPTAYRAEALAEALTPHARDNRFFLARASRGREVLAEMLAAAGAHVEQAVVYESRDLAAPDAKIVELLAGGAIDFTTVTSSAIARSLVNLFGDDLRNTRLVAISPLTASILAKLGYPPAAIAEQYDAPGIVAAISQLQGRKL